MRICHDKVALNELSFSYVSSHLGLWWYMSVLIWIFLSFSLSSTLTLCHTVSEGRISLFHSPWELIHLWLYELDQSVPFVYFEFQVDIGVLSVCWWVCDVGVWQLLVWTVHVISLQVMASQLRVVCFVTATVLWLEHWEIHLSSCMQFSPFHLMTASRKSKVC